MSKDNMKQLEDDFEMKPEYDFRGGIRGRFYSPHKRSTTIRLDDDIILYFKKMAGEAGLNKQRFDECFDKNKYLEIVERWKSQYYKAQAKGTPTFYIGAEEIVGNQPYLVFEEAIEKELEGY